MKEQVKRPHSCQVFLYCCAFFLAAHPSLRYLGEPWPWVTERNRLTNRSETRGVSPLGTVETNGWQIDWVSFLFCGCVGSRKACGQCTFCASFYCAVEHSHCDSIRSPLFPLHWQKFMSPSEVFRWPAFSGWYKARKFSVCLPGMELREAKQTWLSDELSRPALPQSFQDGPGFVWGCLE